MAEDWAADVRKYVPDADEAAIAGIVRHCGIALRSRDASLVSFTDPAETERVRESFLRKKLGLALDDAELDAAIAEVGERMQADRTKNRVTVYYLLAERFGKLGLFVAGSAAAAATSAGPDPEPGPEPDLLHAAAPPPPPPPPAATPAAPVAAPAVAAAAAPLAAAAAMPLHGAGMASAGHPRARERAPDDGGIVSVGLGVVGVMAVAILIAATVGSLAGSRGTDAPPAVSPPQFGPPVPQGAGVVASTVNGQPKVSVYFETASAEVAPEFAAEAAPVKAWIDANPADRLVVSGFNDPRGDRAFNEELSKNRAQNVAAALAAMGVPAGNVELEKPPETTDTTTTLENARRVDIVVRRGG